MNGLNLNFQILKDKYTWKEINNCPGRFVLKTTNKTISIEELLNEKPNINHAKSSKVPDEILIARFTDGGIITYKKNDGTFIHTLNTKEGFNRKLNDLGIDPETIK